MLDAATLQDLSRLELFADCTEDDLDWIASLLTCVRLARGADLIQQGTPAEDFVIIGQGAARVTRAVDGELHELAVVPSGSFVGELSLLGGAPHSATVTAMSALTAYACRQPQFATLLTAPGVRDRVALTAGERRAANRLAAMTGVEITLPDGARLRLRPIVPDDKDKLVQAMEHLSAESRRRRFFTAKGGLGSDALAYFTELDYVDHFAWVALAEDKRGQPIVGVARYMRLADEPGTAEIALTVADSFQGRGLGSILLEALAVAARVNGVERFLAHVLSENAPMRQMLKTAGGRLAHDEPGVLWTVMDVPAPARLVEQPGLDRTLRHAAGSAPVLSQESSSQDAGISATPESTFGPERPVPTAELPASSADTPH